MANEHLRPRDEPIRVGETAPDFTLTNQDRQELSLSDLLARGGDVALSFFPMAFTSVCTSEMECFSSEKPKFEDRNATVVGISCDSFAALKAFAEKHNLDIPLLADMRREVCRAYGFYWPELNVSSRGTVVIGPDGVVKWVSAREPKEAISHEELLGHVG